ncbi:MAG: ATP-binding cassette domain-containing protein [Marmoricola sp.]
MELRIENLGYKYARARQPALDGVNLELGTGMTALVGVNGAGKSTLLSVLARVLCPGSGAAMLDGLDIHRARRRDVAPRVALMPQEFALPATAKVLDALAYLAWLHGVPARHAVRRSEEQLEVVGLAERRGDRVSELSGGMVRRLALAQALVGRPDVLLLDEPTTGLDPEQRAGVRDLLAGGPQAPITLVSSHLMEDVATLADQVVMLHEGAVLFAGAVDAFTARPDGSNDEPEAAFLRRMFGASR